MSVDDEYRAPKHREGRSYFLAPDEFEKNLTSEQRRIVG
jgi:hypothetical protein